MFEWEWAYIGVNKSVPRNVGPECAYYLSPKRQIIETVIVVSISIYALIKTYPKLKVPETKNYNSTFRGGQRLLSHLLTWLWGIEIGFKLSSRTVIYLLNPCHVTTLIQIYLLAAPPSKTVTALFRIHLYLLNGPLLAFLFPETASRTNFAEASLYWIQHGMMFVIPYYLLRIGGIPPWESCKPLFSDLKLLTLPCLYILEAALFVRKHHELFKKAGVLYPRNTRKPDRIVMSVFSIEPLWDFNWAIVSYSLNMIYHFIILQFIAIPAQVNLNHMLCPAILDPFEGPWYRIAAVTHQALLCPLLCKFFCYASDICLTKFPLTKVKPSMEDLLLNSKSNQVQQINNDKHID